LPNSPFLAIFGHFRLPPPKSPFWPHFGPPSPFWPFLAILGVRRGKNRKKRHFRTFCQKVKKRKKVQKSHFIQFYSIFRPFLALYRLEITMPLCRRQSRIVLEPPKVRFSSKQHSAIQLWAYERDFIVYELNQTMRLCRGTLRGGPYILHIFCYGSRLQTYKLILFFLKTAQGREGLRWAPAPSG
jgi:hypothetical protein